MLDALIAYPALAISSAAVLGLLVGSFLNVVILRLPPRMEWQWKRDAREVLELPEDPSSAPPGIVVKGSHCPKCGVGLKPWHNIPVFSWLALRGRCHGCGTGISLQYPAVELITGLLFAVVVWQFGVSWQALAALAFTAVLVAASGIDLRTTLLPDDLTLPLLWLGLLVSISALFVDPTQAIWGAAAGYLSLWSVYWGFKLLTGKEGMGYGDFKLLAALGAWCGASGIIPILLMSSVIGAIVGSIWLSLKGRNKATPIPFGPYLAAAGWVQFLWGEQIVGAYMRYAGLS
ncbi:prepilin peptidase [Aquimonas sp.]|uniref:prepilin peptidase n=1 Tax=Aquimonas sp. TaxID=1872588 RepID=UPI0037C032C7